MLLLYRSQTVFIYFYNKNKVEKVITEGQQWRLHMTDERIQRINELYHKSQKEGLTPEEKEEQARLRYEYVQAIRASLRSNLDQISIQNPDGTIVHLADKKVSRRDN